MPDPTDIEAAIARQEALAAANNAAAAHVRLLITEAAGGPAKQAQDAAAAADKRAQRTALLSPLTSDETGQIMRAELDDRARSLAAQRDSITGRIAYLERLLAVDGDLALSGDERAATESTLAELRAALAVNEPALAAVTAEQGKYPPASEQTQEIRRALRQQGGAPRRGPNGTLAP